MRPDTLVSMFEAIQVILLGFLVTFLVLLAVIGVLIGVYSRNLHRRNRVDPEVESLAPLLWIWKPGQAPRLHRRLQSATSPIARIDADERMASTTEPSGRVGKIAKAVKLNSDPEPEAPSPGSVAGLRQTLRAQAVQMDRDVVLSARLARPARRQALTAIGIQVGQLENLSARLVHQYRQSAAPVVSPLPHPVAAAPPQVLADVSHQLDVLEQAQNELLEIERANGLMDPDELMRQARAPQPAPAPAPVSLPPSEPPAGDPLAQPNPASRARPS